jgi:hypothetical protein
MAVAAMGIPTYAAFAVLERRVTAWASSPQQPAG